MSKEQIAHDLAVAIIINRKINTPAQVLEEYESMYRDILHRLSN